MSREHDIEGEGGDLGIDDGKEEPSDHAHEEEIPDEGDQVLLEGDERKRRTGKVLKGWGDGPPE